MRGEYLKIVKQNSEKKLLSELNYYNSITEPATDSTPGSTPGQSQGGKSIIKGGQSELDNYKESKFRDVLKRSFGMSNVSKLNKKIYKKGTDKEETDNKIGDFNKDIDEYNDNDKADKTIIKKKLLEFENEAAIFQYQLNHSFFSPNRGFLVSFVIVENDAKLNAILPIIQLH
jgi:hypothetical protein